MGIKKRYSYLFLLVLVYMFSFSLGEQRLSLYINYAYLIGLAASGILFLYIVKKRFLKIYPILFYAFLLIQILTLVFGLANGKFLQSVVNSGHQIMFFIIFLGIVKYYELDDYRGGQFLGNFIVLVSSISLLFAFYGFVFGNFSFGPLKYEVVIRHAYRLKGWYSSANYLGPVLALGGITILYRILTAKLNNLPVWLNIGCIILFLFHVSGLTLSGSKGSVIAFLGGVLILLVTLLELNLSLFKKVFLWSVLITISYLTTTYAFDLLGFNATLIQEELIRLDSIENNLEGGDRIGYHLTALEMLNNASLKDLFLGHGLGYFIDTTGSSPHSGFIELIIGRGLIIFSLFGLLISLLAHKSIKLIKHQKIGALYLALLVVIVLKNFTNVEFPSNNFPGIILIFMTAIFSLKNPKFNAPQN